MSSLWIEPVGEEVFRVRLDFGGGRCRAFLYRTAEVLRHVRHGQTAFSLNHLSSAD